MKNTIRQHLEEGIRYRQLTLETCQDSIAQAAELLIEAVNSGNSLYFFGNGGSAADAQHIEAELTGRFMKERRAINARAITVNSSAITAIANDYGYEEIFSRHMQFSRAGDVAIGISTSGQSENVVRGLAMAKSKGCKTIALTGSDSGPIGAQADITVAIPASGSAAVQELHIAIGHIWCQLIEDNFNG